MGSGMFSERSAIHLQSLHSLQSVKCIVNANKHKARLSKWVNAAMRNLYPGIILRCRWLTLPGHKQAVF